MTSGIVTVSGGTRFLVGTYVQIRMIRYLGCHLPIEVWAIHKREVPEVWQKILDELDVEVKFITPEIRESKWSEELGCNIGRVTGFMAKSLACLMSSFDQLLFLDADCYPIIDVTSLVDDFRFEGTLLWPDAPGTLCADIVPEAWSLLGLEPGLRRSCESGQMLWNKHLAIPALQQMARWVSQGHYYFNLGPFYGDKDLYAAACELMGTPFSIMSPDPELIPQGLIQKGHHLEPWFIHRCRDKPRIPDERGSSSYMTPQELGEECSTNASLPCETEFHWFLNEIVTRLADRPSTGQQQSTTFRSPES